MQLAGIYGFRDQGSLVSNALDEFVCSGGVLVEGEFVVAENGRLILGNLGEAQVPGIAIHGTTDSRWAQFTPGSGDVGRLYATTVHDAAQPALTKEPS